MQFCIASISLFIYFLNRFNNNRMIENFKLALNFDEMSVPPVI